MVWVLPTLVGGSNSGLLIRRKLVLRATFTRMMVLVVTYLIYCIRKDFSCLVFVLTEVDYCSGNIIVDVCVTLAFGLKSRQGIHGLDFTTCLTDIVKVELG